MSGYTCIDFETTGLFPTRDDRVLEIGVVFVSEDGQIEGEWSTLVNPERDVGPSVIHGITERDVAKAPTFADIAPLVVQSVAGRTVVAHNAPFDVRFMRVEMARAGLSWTGPNIPALCTMELAGRYMHSSSRRLADCCRAAQLKVNGAHEALADARAVAALLAHVMSVAHPPPPWAKFAIESRSYAWPVVNDKSVPNFVLRTRRAPVREQFWLDRVVAKMPRHENTHVDSYLQVLETALLDRYLSAHEEEALLETAHDLGLNRDRLDAVHRDYLLSMAATALADGIVTKSELNDLETVARLLGLSNDDVATSLDAAKAASEHQPVSSSFKLQRGDQISLTGRMRYPSETIEGLLAERGLLAGDLSKRTRLLVAADPDALDAEARSFGVPVVNEAAFLSLLLTMEG